MSRSKAASRTTEVVPEEEEDVEEIYTPYSPFFSVKYGDDKEAVFNIDCLNKHLVRAIRKKCQLDRKGNYDLIKTNGEMANFWKKPSKDYASQSLQPRTTYILIEMEVPDVTNNQSAPRWRPLLESLAAYPELEELYENKDAYISPVPSATSRKPGVRSKQSVTERTGGDRRSSRAGAVLGSGGDGGTATPRRQRVSVTSRNGKS